jgi:hypothetical protein
LIGDRSGVTDDEAARAFACDEWVRRPTLASRPSYVSRRPAGADSARLTEGGPALNFQPVPEPKQGKTRIRLDLRTDDVAAAIERVEELGGSDLDERHEYAEGTVVVMADPAGNEFCLVRYSGAS